MARPRTPKPASTASVRKLLSEAVAENWSKEDFADIIKAAKGAETSAAAECPECGHTMRVKVPDAKKQMELLVQALEQTEGRAAQSMPESTSIVIERLPR